MYFLETRSSFVWRNASLEDSRDASLVQLSGYDSVTFASPGELFPFDFIRGFALLQKELQVWRRPIRDYQENFGSFRDERIFGVSTLDGWSVQML